MLRYFSSTNHHFCEITLSIFLKIGRANVIDHAIVFKNCSDTSLLGITIPVISWFQTSKILICTHTWLRYVIGRSIEALSIHTLVCIIKDRSKNNQAHTHRHIHTHKLKSRPFMIAFNLWTLKLRTAIISTSSLKDIY